MEVQGPLVGPGCSMVGLLRNAWQCWGVPLTSRTSQRGYLGIRWPLKQARGTAPTGVYIA